MKLYKVKATDTWEYVIEVDEGECPESVAKNVVECSREYDSKGASVEVVGVIKTSEDLPSDWNDTCLPWGSDFEREVWIGEILGEYE